MRVLVVYASRHGATRGIAERIGSTLEGFGLSVSVQPVDRATSVVDADAVVVGSAAYIGRWMSEATEFVRRHAATLATKPVWLFSSGPVGVERVDDAGRDVLEAATPREFAELHDLVHPRDRKVFFGAFDPDQPASGVAERFMVGFLRLMPTARAAMPAGDFRDWPVIEAWAKGIAEALGARTAAAAEIPIATGPR